MDETSMTVQRFYHELPFNYYESTQAAADRLQHNSLPNAYPDLHHWLIKNPGSSIREFGCGAGWLACTLAQHYDVRVTAVDFTEPAIQRATELAQTLGISDRVKFVHSDFLALSPQPDADLVLSIGVLHHTPDAKRSFAHIARFIKPRGSIYLGLYHRYGRRPFLQHFFELLRHSGEEAAFREYAELNRHRATDDSHLRSWFRDQVIHPHETQHSLEEVAQWLHERCFRLNSTSINRFSPIENLPELYQLEKDYEAVSRRALQVERRYFPGFFTVFAVKQDSAKTS